jgi:hypothetical protein
MLGIEGIPPAALVACKNLLFYFANSVFIFLAVS